MLQINIDLFVNLYIFALEKVRSKKPPIIVKYCKLT